MVIKVKILHFNNKYGMYDVYILQMNECKHVNRGCMPTYAIYSGTHFQNDGWDSYQAHWLKLGLFIFKILESKNCWLCNMNLYFLKLWLQIWFQVFQTILKYYFVTKPKIGLLTFVHLIDNMVWMESWAFIGLELVLYWYMILLHKNSSKGSFNP